MARDDYGDIPDPWEEAVRAAQRVRASLPIQRPCVGGPMHKKLLPEEQAIAVVEAGDSYHTYRLMRDIKSNDLCYVHIGSVAKRPPAPRQRHGIIHITGLSS